MGNLKCKDTFITFPVQVLTGYRIAIMQATQILPYAGLSARMRLDLPANLSQRKLS